MQTPATGIRIRTRRESGSAPLCKGKQRQASGPIERDSQADGEAACKSLTALAVAAPTAGGTWAALVIDQAGWIRDSEGALQSTFGYHGCELDNLHVSLLLPQWAEGEYINSGQLSPQFRFRCRIGCLFKGRTKDGDLFDSRLFASRVGDAGSPRFRLTVHRCSEEGEHA